MIDLGRAGARMRRPQETSESELWDLDWKEQQKLSSSQPCPRFSSGPAPSREAGVQS